MSTKCTDCSGSGVMRVSGQDGPTGEKATLSAVCPCVAKREHQALRDLACSDQEDFPTPFDAT